MRRRDFITSVGATVALSAIRVGARQRTDFDYVIVGAGSAGCVLANRLSADPAVRVLLIEAGGPVDDDPAVTTPGRWVSLMGSKYDWGYATEPEAGMQDRRIGFPQGRVHGGSSAINAMAYVRGHRLCYDRWAELGNIGWGYDDLLTNFKTIERNEMGASEFRGGSGELSVAMCADPHAGHRAFLAAASQRGFKSDPRFDFSLPAPDNVAGYYQKNIFKGRRHSAADAFLTPVLARPNLSVHSFAQATRLVVEGRRVVGVAFVRGGAPATARAEREVILCGGVVDSPKLLMLSGIGPADHLRSHGITVAHDSPGVGGNLQDHLKLSIRWSGKTELPGSTVTAGMFTSSARGAVGRVPDLQFYVGRGLETPDRFITITVSLVQPRSRGDIRLRSAEPAAPPVIRANYLQEQADVDALVGGVRLARQFGETGAYGPLRGDEVAPGSSARSDADLAQFVRRESDTIYHGAGTCRMGPDTERMAVVDASLRVKGVEGLRVADASIMPEVVNATTHAAAVMIGEKCAAIIAGRVGPAARRRKW